MRVLLLLAVLAGSPGVRADDEVPAVAVPAAVPAMTAERAAELVEQLAADDFFTREAATRALWAAGPEATRAALERARDGKNEEAAFRARKVLWNFDHGILVGTPPEMVELVAKFHAGNVAVRASLFKSLLERGQIDTMRALYRVADDATRKVLNPVVLGGAPARIATLIAERDLETAGQWIEIAALANPDGQQGRDHLAFLLFRGQLDEHIVAIEKAVAADAMIEDRTALVRALLVAGRNDEAAKRSAGLTNATLGWELALRTGDWAALDDATIPPGDAGVERLGFQLAFRHLAGRTARADEAAEALVALAKESPDRAWMCGEALLIAERWDDAVAVFRDAKQTSTAFELLATRQDYAAAFELLGLKRDGANAVEWFDEQFKDAAVDGRQVGEAIDLAMTLARELKRTRGDEDVRRLLEAVRPLAHRNDVNRVPSLIDVYHELGFEKEALEQAATLLGLPDPAVFRAALRSVFSDREPTAFVWWQFRRGAAKEETPVASLEWVAKLLGGEPVEDFPGLASKLTAMGEKQIGDARRQWLTAVAEVARDREEWEIAVDAYGTVLANYVRADTAIALGDIAAKREQWSDAAAFYARAAEIETDDALMTYLRGLMLQRAGKQEEGESLVELARMLPLSDAARRRMLADGLSERGFDAESRREWETILRVGSHASFEGSDAWAVQMAFARLGNMISDEDPLRAADCWQRYLLYLLKTNAAYSESRRYLGVTHILHRTRSRGFIVTKQYDRAMTEANRAHAAWPGNIELALTLVPLLDEVDRKQDADALFALVNDSATQRVTAFPESAGAKNDLAWLQANCDRRLDDALRHSERAVAIEPGSVAYIDTLAEVHFRRGDVPKAIELAEKCIRIDPAGEHYREQLKRFRAAME